MIQVTQIKQFKLWNGPSHAEIPNIMEAVHRSGSTARIDVIYMGIFKTTYQIAMTGDSLAVSRLFAMLR